MSLIVEGVGAAALAASATAVVPQTVRMVRVQSTAGVSPVWAMLGAVSTAVWSGYTAAVGLWWATVADAIACVSYLSAVRVLAGQGVSPRLGAGAAWAAVFGLGYVAGGLPGVGAVLAVAFVIQVSPSIWTAYRQSDLRGASALTWYLTALEGGLWLLYGAAEDDAAVTTFGVIAVVAGALMVARIHSTS